MLAGRDKGNVSIFSIYLCICNEHDIDKSLIKSIDQPQIDVTRLRAVSGLSHDVLL